MMLRQLIRAVSLFALVAFGLDGHRTFAQTPPPPRQPGYSPYLNLTRPGNVANNYYGLVRPELEFRNSLSNLQQQQNNLNQAVENPRSVDAPFPGTGHATTFMNLSHYYGNRNRGPGIGQGPAAPGPAGAPRRR